MLGSEQVGRSHPSTGDEAPVPGSGRVWPGVSVRVINLVLRMKGHCATVMVARNYLRTVCLRTSGLTPSFPRLDCQLHVAIILRPSAGTACDSQVI